MACRACRRSITQALRLPLCPAAKLARSRTTHRRRRPFPGRHMRRLHATCARDVASFPSIVLFGPPNLEMRPLILSLLFARTGLRPLATPVVPADRRLPRRFLAHLAPLVRKRPCEVVSRAEAPSAWHPHDPGKARKTHAPRAARPAPSGLAAPMRRPRASRGRLPCLQGQTLRVASPSPYAPRASPSLPVSSFPLSMSRSTASSFSPRNARDYPPPDPPDPSSPPSPSACAPFPGGHEARPAVRPGHSTEAAREVAANNADYFRGGLGHG